MMNQILEQLPNLDPVQLRELHARTSALLKAATPAKDEQLIHDAIESVLRRHGHHAPPYGIAKRLAHFKSFKEGARVVENFVSSFVSKKTARMQAYELFVGILYRSLISRTIPATHRTLCQNLRNIPSLIHQQFPGYAQSGLLTAVIGSRLSRPGI